MIIRRRSPVLLCLAALTWGVAGAQARPATPIALHIEAQPVRAALQQFGQQTGLQVLMRLSGKAADDVRVAPLDGEFTAQEGLERLLKDTGLTYEFVNERTVRIAVARTTANDNADRELRLAQAEQGVPESDRADPESTAMIEEFDMKSIPEVLVRGSKSLNTDIQRTEDSAQPYVVLTHEEIERSQAPNLEEFLKTRLPMNTTSATNNQFSGLSNRSSIDLRGLGTNQTLILIDGRRMPRVSDFGTFGQADINGVPLAAVERIEILPSTASGIYGGGATGGVVNIILRRDYQGLATRLTYGNTFGSDVASRKAEAFGGFSLEGGLTKVMLGASYADANPLLARERNFAARSRALLLKNNPGALLDAPTPPTGYTSNICNATEFFPGFGACNADPLVLKSQYGGASLGTSRTFVPVGYAGLSDGVGPLIANAGQYNLDIANSLLYGASSLLNEPRVRTALAGVRRAFGAHIEGFLDFSWLDNESHSSNGAVPESVTLSASAPNNPFTTPIVVSFPATGLSSATRTESQTIRAAGGFLVRLPRDWSAGLDYGWSKSTFSVYSNAEVVGDPDGFLGPGVPVTTALGDGTLDVVRDLNAHPLDWTPYLMPQPNFNTYPSDNVLKDVSLRFSGPVAALPAGALMLSGNIAHRKETAEDTILDFATFGFAALAPERSQKVNSYYLEANTPLISPAQQLKFARSLDFLASVRRDEYRTTSSDPGFTSGPSKDGPFAPDVVDVSNRIQATKYTLALRYSPIDSLTLRASRGTGFLPPTVDQLQQTFNPVVPITDLLDPKRGSLPGTIVAAVTGGGNLSLKPEDSSSWSFGAIFAPVAVPGLRVSLDYTLIKKTGEITALTEQDLLNLEDVFPDRVTRAPLTPADQALGFTGGQIIAFDTRLLNAQSSRLKAYDLQLDYSWRTERLGAFHFYSIATLQPSFTRQTLPDAPNVERVGRASGPLRWRGNAGLDWSLGAWDFGWNLQYFHSYLAYPPGTDQGVIDAITLARGSARIRSQTYNDLFATWRVPGAGLFRDVEATIGIQNVLNQSPPISIPTGANAGYSYFGDPRLRRYSISLKKSFK